MNLVLLGAPGAGKGTQADILRQKTGMYTLSTGNLLRESVKAGTELGKKVKDLLSTGSLVSDEIVLSLVREKLASPECAKGVIFDGFPRTVHQAEELDKLTKVENAVLFDVSDEEIEERMSFRRICPKCQRTYHLKALPPKTPGLCDVCGVELQTRADDEASVVRKRLEVYHKETEPIIDYYRRSGRLVSIDGTMDPEVISGKVLAVAEAK